jgi:hypothetical protein
METFGLYSDSLSVVASSVASLGRWIFSCGSSAKCSEVATNL